MLYMSISSAYATTEHKNVKQLFVPLSWPPRRASHGRGEARIVGLRDIGRLRESIGGNIQDRYLY